MEIEPRPDQPPAPVTEEDREQAVEVLQRAAADGRLPLEEFSDRVAAALAAETREQLESGTVGLKTAPPVGSTRTVSTVVTFLGDRRQVGRWRLPRSLRAIALLGDVHLDLRGVVVSDEVVEISAFTLLGDFSVDVPEGVEVELTGFDLLGDRELRLTPVARRGDSADPGTRVRGARRRDCTHPEGRRAATELVAQVVARQREAPLTALPAPSR